MKKIITIVSLLGIVALWGYYFYPQKTKIEAEIVPTISPPIISDFDQIKQALAIKHNKPLVDTNFTLSQNDGSHASGGVVFSGEIAGAWVLAAKNNNQWLIVQDGNGTVSCELVLPYAFPKSMVPECVDNQGKLHKL